MSIFIQEVLGLLNRNQKKITLDKTKDWFEFGKLYQSSSLNNKSGYAPKMDPFVIKWGDFIGQATEDLTRTLPGQGNLGYIPVYTDPSGTCNWDTLKDSIITQNSLNTIINIAGDLTVTGTSSLNGNVNLGNNIGDIIRLYGTLYDNNGNGPLPNQVLVGQTGGVALWQNDDVVETLTLGAIWVGNSSNLKQELPIGLVNKVLISNGTTLTYGSSVILAPIGSVSNANGATFTGNTLNLEPASINYGGVVTTGVQTFTGNKTFTGELTAQKLIKDGGTLREFLMADGSVTIGNGGVYTYEIHVSQIDGNDTTGTGAVLNPVASITKALTLVYGQTRTIIIHPGNYTENPSITSQYTVLTTYQATGGNTLITGTVTTNTGCSISGLKMTNLTITGVSGTGNINILNCDISGTLTKSGTADYVLIRFCDIGNPQAGTGGLNVTSSAGLTAVFGGNPNFINVNNAGARVLVKNATTAASVLLAGSLTFADSIILALATQWVTGTTYAVGSLAYNLGFTYIRIVAGAGSTAPASDPTNWFLQSSLNGIDTRNAITTAIGSVVTIANSQIIVPTFQNVARVSLSGFYSILNCVYDRTNSILVAGGSTNSIGYSQFINADKFIKEGGTPSEFLMADGSVTTGSTRPYKVYTALLTQTGTSAPTAIVLENTLGVTPTLGYNNVGQYSISATGAFTIDKTWIIFNSVNANAQTISNNLKQLDGVSILTRSMSGTSINDVLNSTEIEIRVYN